MPDLCFYAPWIMKEPIPDPFRMMLEKAGKKRISYDAVSYTHLTLPTIA